MLPTYYTVRWYALITWELSLPGPKLSSPTVQKANVIIVYLRDLYQLHSYPNLTSPPDNARQPARCS